MAGIVSPGDGQIHLGSHRIGQPDTREVAPVFSLPLHRRGLLGAAAPEPDAVPGEGMEIGVALEQATAGAPTELFDFERETARAA